MSKATLEPTIANSTASSDWYKKNSAPQLVEGQKKIMQTINFSLGEFDDEKRTFRAIASSDCIDRSGDTIDQDGWDLTNFKMNPVIPWAHDYYSPPVARAIAIGVVDDVLQFTYQAPPKGMNEFADMIWDMYRNQFLFAFSVGFIPKKLNGEPLDFNDYSWDGNNFEAAELLEISAVVVPANPQALALAYKSGMIDERQAKQLIAKTQAAVKNLEEAIVKENKKTEDTVITLENLTETVEKVVSKLFEQLNPTTKGALSSDLAINSDKDTKWDSGAAIKAIKDYASTDGDIDFGKYKKAFLWVDSAEEDKQGGYKLPIADVFDGELKVVWNAVKAVMGVLNGGRGGVDIPEADKKSVYNQVKKYYKKFGEDVPEFNPKSLTPEERHDENTTMSKKAAKGTIGQAHPDIVAVKDGLATMCSVMNTHAEALDGHAATMTAHANLVRTQTDTLTKAVSSLTDLLDNEYDNTRADAGPDGKSASDSEGDGLDDAADTNDKLDSENPDTSLSRSKSVETKDVEDGETKEPAEKEDKVEAETTTTDDVTSTDEDATKDTDDENADDEVKSEDENPTDGADQSDELTDDTEVDPDDLTEEQAEAVLKHVNEVLNNNEG